MSDSEKQEVWGEIRETISQISVYEQRYREIQQQMGLPSEQVSS